MQNPLVLRNRMHVEQCKLERSCCDACKTMVNYETMQEFDFDHVDPRTKLFPIAHPGARSLEHIDAELEKCRLLCSPCHRQHAKEQRMHRL